MESNKRLNIEIKDNSKRAKTLITIFWILTGLTFVEVLVSYVELRILEKIYNGEYVNERLTIATDTIQGLIGMIQIVLYAISVVVFINWFKRAYGNLHRLGITNLKYTETMAAWAWFIPILSFYRPVVIMNEIWTETQKEIKKRDSAYTIISGKSSIGLWWVFFISSIFIGAYILELGFNLDTLESLIENLQAILISDILNIPEALLVIFIVSKLSKMESKLADLVKKSGGRVV